MTTDFLINTVLLAISKKSGFSQQLNIKFETKNEWNGYVHLWLFPFFYAHGTHDYEHNWRQTDFHNLYLIEKEPIFLCWSEIIFGRSDRLLDYIVDLKSNKNDEPHRSQYSGHLYVGWRNLVD